MEKALLVILIGYLMGCLQWSYILGKTIKRTDIRTLGGGNAGASNTVTVFGWKMGVAVGLLDIIKAIISILIIRYFIRNFTTLDLYLNGTSVILGHNFPFYMKFKGGKGTASTLGMLFGIDYRLGIIGFIVILAVTVFTDFIALGTISLVIFFILATIYLGFGTACVLITIFIAIMSIYKHISNIKSILAKEEPTLRDALRKKQKSI